MQSQGPIFFLVGAERDRVTGDPVRGSGTSREAGHFQRSEVENGGWCAVTVGSSKGWGVITGTRPVSMEAIVDSSLHSAVSVTTGDWRFLVQPSGSDQPSSSQV